jgi:nucleotide-binding universal stress UspA family protein
MVSRKVSIKERSMDRLIVATDFSARSDRALRRAVLIAKRVNASLVLVHVVDSDWPERLIASDRAAAVGLLEDTAATLRGIDGIATEVMVVVDDVHSGILSAADRTSADLIIIGPHRASLRDVFVGTTAERVVRRSTRPLMVAVETPSAQHRKTLLALDFDEASKAAARHALAMGVFDHMEVVAMHAFDAPGESMMRRAMEHSADIGRYVDAEKDSAAEELRTFLNDLGLPPTCQTVVSMEGTPARAILEAARSVDSDLIVLGTNQRKGFERALVGSVTADVIRDAHRDVLIIPVNEVG